MHAAPVAHPTPPPQLAAHWPAWQCPAWQSPSLSQAVPPCAPPPSTTRTPPQPAAKHVTKTNQIANLGVMVVECSLKRFLGHVWHRALEVAAARRFYLAAIGLALLVDGASESSTVETCPLHERARVLLYNPCGLVLTLRFRVPSQETSSTDPPN